MRITRFQIHNYKSFLSSEELHFTPGFNVVVGKNNVGKTAFVQALSLQFENKPHLSLKTMPYVGAIPHNISDVHISFELERDELLSLMVDYAPQFHLLGLPGADVSASAEKFIQSISGKNIFRCIYQPGGFISAYPEAYGDTTSSDQTMYFTIDRLNRLPQLKGSSNTKAQETLPYNLAGILQNRIYLFRAERLNVGQYGVGHTLVLQPDASNLAQVLDVLQGRNPSRYRKLNRLVTTVFPEIKEVGVAPIPDNPSYVRISLWTIDPDSERYDLTVPLQESGTGIGQVLAMLYVVLTSDFPRTIIIDEPQSFLHPGAIRKLFDILKQYPQHQYIITTHSPTVITAADPQQLFLIRKQEAESKIETIDVAETQKLRLYLSEIGARLSDVFGMDNILWVEGPTEERCFPLILERLTKRPLLGTSILGVKHTGDFKGKHKKLVIDIYNQLSGGQSLLPPALGFIFDREGLSEQDQKELRHQSNDAVTFLERTMYENYLLNPQAIAAVASSIQGFRDSPVSAEEIAAWIDQHASDKKYLVKGISDEEQQKRGSVACVDGAKLLQDIFGHFSESRVDYDGNKIEYGLALTSWLIENAPNDLDEIVKLLTRVLSGATSTL